MATANTCRHAANFMLNASATQILTLLAIFVHDSIFNAGTFAHIEHVALTAEALPHLLKLHTELHPWACLSSGCPCCRRQSC